jgi:hypothetical protein
MGATWGEIGLDGTIQIQDYVFLYGSVDYDASLNNQRQAFDARAKESLVVIIHPRPMTGLVHVFPWYQ